MALTIPSYAGVGVSAEQSAPDPAHFASIVAGINDQAVVSGLGVTQRGAGANMSVDVAAGFAIINNQVTSFSLTNVAITADPTNPRWALIYISSGGVVTGTMGTAAATSPVIPVAPAGAVALAAVFVPAGATSVVNADINDLSILQAAPQVVGSGASGSDALTIWGRTTNEAIAGIVGTAQTTDSVAGDLLVRVNDATKVVRLRSGPSTGAAQLVVGSAAISIPSGVDLTVGTKSTKSGTLSLPATANNSVFLWQVTSTAAAIALRIHAHLVPTSGTPRTKTYEFVVDTSTDTTNTYYKLLPADQSAAQSATEDFFFVVYRPSTATTTWQIWACSSSTFASAATLTWSVESYGDAVVSLSTTKSPATTNPTLPFTGGLHPSNNLDTVAGRIGIGTDTPSLSLHLSNPSGTGIVLFDSVSGTDSFVVAGVNAGGSYTAVGSVQGGHGFSDTATGDGIIGANTASGSLRLGVKVDTSGGAAPSASMLQITSSDVLINDNGTARTAPRGMLAESHLTVTSAAVTSASATNISATSGVSVNTTPASPAAGTTGNLAFTVNVVSGRRYKIEIDINANSSTASIVSTYSMSTAGTATGTLYGQLSGTSRLWHGTTGFLHQGILTGWYYCTANGTLTCTARVASNGTASVTIGAGSSIAIWDLG